MTEKDNQSIANCIPLMCLVFAKAKCTPNYVLAVGIFNFELWLAFRSN